MCPLCSTDRAGVKSTLTCAAWRYTTVETRTSIDFMERHYQSAGEMPYSLTASCAKLWCEMLQVQLKKKELV